MYLSYIYILCEFVYFYHLGWGTTVPNAFGRETEACKKHWNCTVGFCCLRLSVLINFFNLWFSEIMYNILTWRNLSCLSVCHVPPCRYAICGDETIKIIALRRPSTKARLANIDGVNQVCLNKMNNNICSRILASLLSVNDEGYDSCQISICITFCWQDQHRVTASRVIYNVLSG